MDASSCYQIKRFPRHPIADGRICSLSVITFESLEWICYTTRMVDISITGIGVESESHIKPGIIWFRDCVYGLKFGKLVWCKQFETRYRAGIQLIRLSKQDEECLQEDMEHFQSDQLSRHQATQIEALIERYRLY